MMLKLETAKALKDAGLRRGEFEKGDCFYWDEPYLIISSPIQEYEYPIVIYEVITVISSGEPAYKTYSFSRQGGFYTLNRQLSEEEPTNYSPKVVWLPTLSQLLAEIERRGYGWSLHTNEPDLPIYIFSIYHWETQEAHNGHADSPEEAAAAALLWILKTEGAID